MFEPLTLRMPELAERWKMTPVQALEFADVNGLPIYFNFSGLAFFDSNEWCRTHGDQDTRKELEILSAAIASGESHFARRSRGETGSYLTDQEAQELRQCIEANKRRCKAIKEMLEQREIDRKRYRYSGPMGAGQKTLFEIRQSGKSGWPRFGVPPGRNELIFLEYFTDSSNGPLTMDSLFVVLQEVKAGEIYFKAKQTAQEPQAAPPAPVADSASNAPACDFSVLATREQLIEAFGRFTGMDASWFKNITDTPALLAARKVTGQGGRGHIAEPWFCPFEVMQWLADSKRRKGRKLSTEKAWELLEKNFPKIHSAHSVADTRASD